MNKKFFVFLSVVIGLPLGAGAQEAKKVPPALSRFDALAYLVREVGNCDTYSFNVGSDHGYNSWCLEPRIKMAETMLDSMLGQDANLVKKALERTTQCSYYNVGDMWTKKIAYTQSCVDGLVQTATDLLEEKRAAFEKKELASATCTTAAGLGQIAASSAASVAPAIQADRVPAGSSAASDGANHPVGRAN